MPTQYLHKNIIITIGFTSDDASPDGTSKLVADYIAQSGMSNKVTMISNATRQGAMFNQYHAIHSCIDNAIVIILDGDDWFPHDRVLEYINRVYQDPLIWLTYGQFIEYPINQVGFLLPYTRIGN